MTKQSPKSNSELSKRLLQSQAPAQSILDLLPQTQCELCDYPGCKPYALAIEKNEADINKCLPGGEKTLLKLAALLNKNPEPYLKEIREKQKAPTMVRIREDECIGCVKCITVCPTDAIVGAAKLMHTVIAKDCTGCELCIPACPMDCIDIIAIPEKNDEEQKQKSQHWRTLYENRQARLERDEKRAKQKHQTAKLKIADMLLKANTKQ